MYSKSSRARIIIVIKMNKTEKLIMENKRIFTAQQHNTHISNRMTYNICYDDGMYICLYTKQLWATKHTNVVLQVLCTSTKYVQWESRH